MVYKVRECCGAQGYPKKAAGTASGLLWRDVVNLRPSGPHDSCGATRTPFVRAKESRMCREDVVKFGGLAMFERGIMVCVIELLLTPAT